QTPTLSSRLQLCGITACSKLVAQSAVPTNATGAKALVMSRKAAQNHRSAASAQVPTQRPPAAALWSRPQYGARQAMNAHT
ncbi:unnamed protein product, partial [Tilletia controversa]